MSEMFEGFFLHVFLWKGFSFSNSVLHDESSLVKCLHVNVFVCCQIISREAVCADLTTELWSFDFMHVSEHECPVLFTGNTNKRLQTLDL